MASPKIALLMAAGNQDFKREHSVTLGNVWRLVFPTHSDRHITNNALGLTDNQADKLSDARLIGTEQQAIEFVRQAFGEEATSVGKFFLFSNYKRPPGVVDVSAFGDGEGMTQPVN